MIRGRPSATILLTGALLVLAILWSCLLGIRHIRGEGSVLDRFEYLSLDVRFVLLGPRPPPADIVIVAIDDNAVHDFGVYPLPRALLGKIVEVVAATRPKVVAVDLAFLDPAPPADDEALARALGLTSSVIAAIGQFDNDLSDEDGSSPALAGVPRPQSVLAAVPALQAAARSGLVNVVTDASGIARYVPMIYRVDDAIAPSLVLAAAAGAVQAEPVFGATRLRIGTRSIWTDLGYHLPIRHYGPAGSIARIGAAQLLRGTFDPAAMRDHVVVLGVTAAGVGDVFATPFDRVVPGAEVLATAIGNLLAGDGLVRTVAIRRIDAAVGILMACATVLLMSMKRAFVGLAAASLLVVIWGALTFQAFAAGYWFSVAVPCAAFVPVAILYGGARIGLDRHLAGRLAADKTALMRFQSPLLLRQILSDPEFLIRPVLQDLAIVFLDLSGFTGLTERLGPDRTREMIAEFQVLVEREVADCGGYVASFMGDGAMIVFGLPSARVDDAARALRAVTRLHAAVTGWIAASPALGRDRLSVRVGGHFGPAVASRLGPAHHQHIAATGDTVNVANRLLEVGKQQNCSVVVSETLFAAAHVGGTHPHVSSAPGLEVAIRGRAKPVRIRILG